MGIWTILMMLSPNKTWGTFETVFTVALIGVSFLALAWRIYFAPRIFTDYVWREYG